MKVSLERQGCYIRHVRRRQAGETGGVEVLGDFYIAQDLEGVNGEQGWQSGTYEPHEGEEGSWAITLPNAVGGDRELHRRRFLILTSDDFREGDEFIEFYEGDPPAGRLLWVGMVTGGSKRGGSVELRGTCPFGEMKLQRETRAGFWTGHAPRDVFEFYMQGWQVDPVDDFAAQEFTYSTGEQTTPDGVWIYRRGENSQPPQTALVLRPAEGFSQLRAAAGVALDEHAAWRLEMELERSSEAFSGIQLGLRIGATTDTWAMIEINPTNTFAATENALWAQDLQIDTAPGKVAVAIEGRDRWTLFYIDGQLKAVLPTPTTLSAADLRPFVTFLSYLATDSGVTLAVHNVLMRRTRPYLLRGAAKGDYRIPGAPPVGGLVGVYYSDSDLRAKHAADTYRHVLSPTRTPYVRRTDVMVNYAAATPHQSVRWTGSVYLDLEAFDIRLRVYADDRARVWVGKTRMGEQLLDDWTSAGHGAPTSTTSVWLRTIFGAVSGWYPIVVEASNDSGSMRALLEAEKSTAPGVWLIAGNTGVDEGGLPLSPLGCFAQQVQGDTHYEMLIALRDAVGLQFTCEPRSLESGEFPGQVVPRVRLGRDTEYVLDDLGAVEPVVEINAEASVDEVIVDGSGLSDPDQGTQQTYVATDFAALRAGRKMVHSEQESLSDISDLALLQQRAASLLALRSSPWEDVQAQPEDKSRKLIDRFPLTGELAEFDWGVGDGIRLAFEDIDVIDEVPRQIKVVAWPMRPDGRGHPAAGFRQRPRNLPAVLRRLGRLAQLPQRNYQGQLVAVVGNVGATPAPAAAGGVTDNWSRASLPDNLGRVKRAEFVVHTKGDASAMNIEVNGTNRLTFTTVGRYDITAYVKSAGVSGGVPQPRMFARATGGTGGATYALELLVAD